MKLKLNQITHGDCIEVLKDCEPFADLIFADPPFNIGYKYDKYQDKVKGEQYVEWSEKWMTACKKVLKPGGSFYIAIGDDYAASIQIIATQKLKLKMRNWIIWHYTFGQQMKNKFARSHTHIFYFVLDNNNFTFNSDAVRVISDRQKKYKDKRANPLGKLPDDVWNEYPRICGTFDERTEFHPCQMPESLLARIIRVSSDKGNTVLDPFSGSGTTPVVASKLGRNYVGIEISSNYVHESTKRLEVAGNDIEGEVPQKWTKEMDMELKWIYHENKISTEDLCNEPELLVLFTEKVNLRLGREKNPFTPVDIKKHLTNLRKAAKLGPLRGQ
ncbi:MAG: hypothetical protein A2Y07_11015 [Planctomycetes bacterium GWF2_50_10]|nr:MAG: hypothetical protein A2Y07_11015 [Planctomycetes bacterium GWF2_50_10]